MVFRCRADRRFDVDRGAAGRGILPILSVSLRDQGGFLERATGFVRLETVFDRLSDFRLGTSRMVSGPVLRLCLPGPGLRQEATGRRHHRSRHHQLSAWLVGRVEGCLAVLVSRAFLWPFSSHFLARHFGPPLFNQGRWFPTKEPDMHTNEYLFPQRLTRRDFVKAAGAATASIGASLMLPSCATSNVKPPPVRLGSSYHTYEVVEGWGLLPEGMKYGFGCGVVVDGQDRVYVTSRSTNPCVAVFNRRGKLLETWSNDFASKVSLTTAQVQDTAHCIYWSKEGPEEFFYWTENSATTKEQPAGVGRRVYKTDP